MGLFAWNIERDGHIVISMESWIAFDGCEDAKIPWASF